MGTRSANCAIEGTMTDETGGGSRDSFQKAFEHYETKNETEDNGSSEMREGRNLIGIESSILQTSSF
jgi:hypothetical protein